LTGGEVIGVRLWDHRDHGVAPWLDGKPLVQPAAVRKAAPGQTVLVGSGKTVSADRDCVAPAGRRRR
jgi:hypothetical protein